MMAPVAVEAGWDSPLVFPLTHIEKEQTASIMEGAYIIAEIANHSSRNLRGPGQ